MAAFVSYTSFDSARTVIVPVIASFDTNGHITPLYVRIGHTPYKVESFYVSTHYTNLTEFCCKVIDGELIRPLQLSYYSVEGMWTINRDTTSA